MNVMKKQTTIIAISLSLILLLAAGAFAAAQTICPVMGGTINKKLYSDHNGERVYFCCQACLPQFAKDPEKYVSKLKAMGQDPERLETDK